MESIDRACIRDFGSYPNAHRILYLKKCVKVRLGFRLPRVNDIADILQVYSDILQNNLYKGVSALNAALSKWEKIPLLAAVKNIQHGY